jgi:hypothetical protein
MELESGMGGYNEDFVERWHQEGKRDDIRTRGMREKTMKFFTISRWEQMDRNPQVIEIQKDLKKKSELSEVTKQKMKSTKDDNLRARKKNITNKEREQA